MNTAQVAEGKRIHKKIISGCKRRDRKSEYELYKLCYGVICGVCMRYGISKQDRGDVINRVFMKVLNALDAYDSKRDYIPWVMTIAIRSVIDHHRKEQRRPIHQDVDEIYGLNGDSLHTYNEYEFKWSQEELLHMMQVLPPTTRQVFNLYAIDGFKHREIGELMSMSENTSKWHVANARKLLQGKLKEQKKIEISHEEAGYR